jgi:cytochrome c oxidase subunit IV
MLDKWERVALLMIGAVPGFLVLGFIAVLMMR